MLSNAWDVGFIFRCLDLLIVIGLSVYVFRRWVLPLVKKNIEIEQQEKKDLLKSVENLYEKSQTLDQRLASDTEHIAHLEHQVRIWHESIKRKQNKRQTEKEDITIRLQKAYAQRVQGIQEQLVYSAVVPEAIKNAKQQLEVSFDGAKNRAFVDTLINAMQEEQQ